MQSSRAEQEAFGHCLIDKAKKTGYYIDPSKLDSFGERKRKPSGECVVYIDEANNRVIKVKDPYAKAPLKGHATEDAIYEHIVHNLLFPDTEYRLLGISESSIGDVRFILEQEYLKDGYEPTTQKQIDEYLSKELNLIKEGKYWYGNDFYAITDVDAASDNVLSDNSGKLYFIDPIIKFKKSAKDVIDFLTQSLDIGLIQPYVIEHALMDN
jgi:hypothetical protein